MHQEAGTAYRCSVRWHMGLSSPQSPLPPIAFYPVHFTPGHQPAFELCPVFRFQGWGLHLSFLPFYFHQTVDSAWPMKLLVAQSCPTSCDPMDCSLPGSSVHGILQARMLEWVAIPFSRGSSWPRDWTWISCVIAGRFFTVWATREAHLVYRLYVKTCLVVWTLISCVDSASHLNFLSLSFFFFSIYFY